ncbi:MAG: hypothetical protein QM754_02350 [Tepidisphaeraceae bacterium]
MNTTRAFPLHADAKKWFKAEKIGFKDTEFGRMKKGELVLEKNIHGVLRMLLSATPGTRDARGKQKLIEFIKTNDAARIGRRITVADCADAVCEPGINDSDSLRGGEDLIVEILRKNIIHKIQINRGFKKCRDPDTVEAVIDWMHVDEGRQLSGMPDLPVDAAIRLASRTWATPIDEVKRCAIAWETHRPQSILFGTNHRGTPTDVSIVLPVKAKIYNEIRAGLRSPHEIGAAELESFSPYLILYAAARRPPEFGGDRGGDNVYHFLGILAQMSELSANADPLHLLSFAASKVAEARLISTGFTARPDARAGDERHADGTRDRRRIAVRP